MEDCRENEITIKHCQCDFVANILCHKSTFIGKLGAGLVTNTMYHTMSRKKYEKYRDNPDPRPARASKAWVYDFLSHVIYSSNNKNLLINIDVAESIFAACPYEYESCFCSDLGSTWFEQPSQNLHHKSGK